MTALALPVAADAVGSSRASATSLTCGTTARLGQGTPCTARVFDNGSPPGSLPTGVVSFGSTDVGALGGCQLAPDGATESSCQVIYSPDAAGSQTLTATYSGDPIHSPSSGTATVNVVPLRPPFLKLAKPKLDKSDGTASLVATIHILGRLSLFGPDVALQKRKLVGPGDVKLPIVPDAKIAGRLRRNGHARVKVTVRFDPHGNTPFEEGSKSEHVTLKRRP